MAHVWEKCLELKESVAELRITAQIELIDLNRKGKPMTTKG